jgi:hypothetical protein
MAACLAAPAIRDHWLRIDAAGAGLATPKASKSSAAPLGGPERGPGGHDAWLLRRQRENPTARAGKTDASATPDRASGIRLTAEKASQGREHATWTRWRCARHSGRWSARTSHQSGAGRGGAAGWARRAVRAGCRPSRASSPWWARCVHSGWPPRSTRCRQRGPTGTAAPAWRVHLPLPPVFTGYGRSCFPDLVEATATASVAGVLLAVSLPAPDESPGCPAELYQTRRRA